MADRPAVTTKPLTRNKLASFLKSPELIKAFENMTSDVATVLPDATEAINVDLTAVIAAAAAAQAAADAAQGTADAGVAAAATAQTTANSGVTAAAAAQSTANAGVAAAATAQGVANAAQADANALEIVPYVTIALSGTTTNERALAVDPLSLKLTDGGPGNSVTLATADLTSILGADVSDSTGAFVNATGMALALLANATYMIDGLITFQSAAVTTGIALGFTLPAGASISGLYHHNTTATAIEGSYNNASGAVKGNTSGVLTAADNVPITGRWIIKTAATAGNAQLQFRSAVAASQVTLKAGLSALTARRIA